MKFKNLKDLLSSDIQDNVIKGLVILSKNPQPEFLDDVNLILENCYIPIVRIMALKALDKIKIQALLVEETKGQHCFTSKFNSFSPDDKLKILQAIKLGKEDFSMGLDEISEIYYMENDNDVLLKFADTIVSKFYGKSRSIIPELNNETDLGKAEKSAILLIFLDSLDDISHIIEIYLKTELLPLITAASFFLWKYSPAIVCGKLKCLMDSKDTQTRLHLSTILKTIKSSLLKGLIEPLILDLNENISLNASEAYLALTTCNINDVKLTKPNDSSVYEKLKVFFANSTNIPDILAVLNIIDQLEEKKFLESVTVILEKYDNPFLISSCCKYIGKHSPEKYSRLKTFLEHKDPRVIANTVEGLNGCVIPEYIEWLKNEIRNNHHRVKSVVAIQLWETGHKKPVSEFLKNATVSSKVWERKAALYTIKQINSKSLLEHLKILFNDLIDSIADESRALFEKINGPDPEAEKLMNDIIMSGHIPDHMLNDKIKELTDPDISLYEKKKSASMLQYLVPEAKILKNLFEDEKLHISIRMEILNAISVVVNDPAAYMVQLLYHPATITRLTALKILGDHDCKPYIDEITPVLFDENRDVMVNAIILLSIYVPDNVKMKIRSMTLSSDVETRKLALFAIRRIGTYALYQIAGNLMNDESAEVSLYASAVVDELADVKDFPKIEIHDEIEVSDSIEKEVLAPEEIDTGKSHEYGDKIDVSDINIIEIINSVSRVKNQQIIDEKLLLIEPVIGLDSISEILSIMETSTNGVLLTSLTRLILKFSHLEHVENMIKEMINHSNKWISSDSIAALQDADKPILLETLIEKYGNSCELLKTSILKVFLLNKVYGESISETYLCNDAGFIIKALGSTDFSEQIKVVDPKKGKEKRKVLKPKPKELPALKFDMSNVPVKSIIIVACFIILYFAVNMQLSRNIKMDQEMVKENVKLPIQEDDIQNTNLTNDQAHVVKNKSDQAVKATNKPVVKKIKSFQPFEISLDEAKLKWSKLDDAKTAMTSKVKAAKNIIECLKLKYYKGEFYIVENLLKENKFLESSNLFLKTIKHIENDDALIEPLKGKWISRKKMDDHILDILIKNKSGK